MVAVVHPLLKAVTVLGVGAAQYSASSAGATQRPAGGVCSPGSWFEPVGSRRVSTLTLCGTCCHFLRRRPHSGTKSVYRAGPRHVGVQRFRGVIKVRGRGFLKRCKCTGRVKCITRRVHIVISSPQLNNRCRIVVSGRKRVGPSHCTRLYHRCHRRVRGTTQVCTSVLRCRS